MASEAAEPSHCVDIVLGSSGPENGGAPLDALWDLDEETCVPPSVGSACLCGNRARKSDPCQRKDIKGCRSALVLEYQ